MNKGELVQAAIAKMDERREEERRERERQDRERVARNAEELARILELYPYLAEYEPIPMKTGIWIRLPECHGIQVVRDAQGDLSFGVTTSQFGEFPPRAWMSDIYRAIENAHDAFNGN